MRNRRTISGRTTGRIRGQRTAARRLAASVLVLLGFGLDVAGQDVYIDPVGGSAAGDGSAAQPWRTFAEVIAAHLIETRAANGTAVNPGAPIHAGATIHLRSGYHGDVSIQTAFNDTVITVTADPGQTPLLGRLQLRSVGRWTFHGLSISPSHRPTYQTIDIVSADSASADVTVEDCEIFSIADAAPWTAAQWISTASNGIANGAARASYLRNRVRNVRFGISQSGTDALVSRNVVDGFSADGMRGLGDRCVYEYNTVKNCYVSDAQGDANHDDGFQSWSDAGGPGLGAVSDVTLRGNLFIDYDSTSLPLRTEMQGIGCFDGFYDRWVVENNVVITNHWHGISFYGMRDGRIVNNTVIDVDSTAPGPPWILVTDHKTRGHSERCLVRNNIAQGGSSVTAGQVAMVIDHNLTATNLAALFLDAPNFDLRLRAGSPAIDAGDPGMAPTIDRLGVARPQGAAVDLGAYESGGAVPVNLSPVSRPTATVLGGANSLTVSLVGSTSSDADGTIASYDWNLGDGGTATGATATHAFAAAGTYTVRLTVTDDHGATGEATVVVVVGEVPGARPSGGGRRCGVGSAGLALLGLAMIALRGGGRKRRTRAL